ncbi:MAG: bifunctional glycosyltransferase family 2/GtrA family protein [Solobacterium sp.]|nr:bifunctional glycosyltransferase family 2/GtrA family protein [Solobacterium sp.]
MKKYVLIPAYCPDQRLPSFVRSLSESGLTPVITDDGSPKEYETIFEQCRNWAEVLRHDTNRGKGAALKTMLAWLMEKETEEYAAVTADADGQHALSDVIRCVDAAASHPSSLVLGVRDFSGPDVPEKSRTGNRVTAAAFRFITGRSLSDTQTGLRAFHCSLAEDLYQTKGDRYEYEMNMLLDCVRKDIPFYEIEIDTIYENNNECSHFRPVRDSLRILKPVLMFALSSLTGFLIDWSGFILFSSFMPVIAANVTARILSASANYEINRRVVFKDGRSSTSLCRYALSALVILVLNSCMLYTLVNGAGMNRFAAKLLCECSLFFLSYLIQRSFVFNRKGVLQ